MLLKTRPEKSASTVCTWQPHLCWMRGEGALPKPDHLLLHRDDLVFPRALPPSVPGRLPPRQGEVVVENFEKIFQFFSVVPNNLKFV